MTKKILFQIWNTLKQLLSDKKAKNLVYFHEREVWFCHVGKNIGFEQDGKGKEFLRPVLIIKKFNKQVAWIIPLTSKNHTGKFYHQIISPINQKNNVAILSQIKLIDQKRLKYRIRIVAKNEFSEIIEKIKNLFPI